MVTSCKLDTLLNNHRYIKGNTEIMTHQRYANESIKLRGGVFTQEKKKKKRKRKSRASYW